MAGGEGRRIGLGALECVDGVGGESGLWGRGGGRRKVMEGEGKVPDEDGKELGDRRRLG